MDPPPQQVPAVPVEKTSIKTWIVIGLVIILVAVIIYYAYSYFSEKKTDSFVEGQRQERADPQSDFDLRESIKRLEQLQSNILKNVTAVYG